MQIKGKGSAFVEPSLGRESDDPTYLHITYLPLIVVANVKWTR